MICTFFFFFFVIFFFNDTATTEIYTLSLHDALPILPRLYTSKVAAGVGIVLASLIPVNTTLGINTPLFALLTSSIELGSGVLPVVFIPTPCPKEARVVITNMKDTKHRGLLISMFLVFDMKDTRPCEFLISMFLVFDMKDTRPCVCTCNVFIIVIISC